MQPVNLQSPEMLKGFQNIGKRIAIGGAAVLVGMIALRLLNLSPGLTSFAKGASIAAGVVTLWAGALYAMPKLMLYLQEKEKQEQSSLQAKRQQLRRY